MYFHGRAATLGLHRLTPETDQFDWSGNRDISVEKGPVNPAWFSRIDPSGLAATGVENCGDDP